MVASHRKGGNKDRLLNQPRITDDEFLDEAFGLNRKDDWHHGDLAWVKNRPGGMNIGHGHKLAQYTDYDGGTTAEGDEAPTAYWCFFGTDWTCKIGEVAVVRKVTVIWA